MPIGSILGKAVKNLPEDFVTKAESLPNILKKAGVKQEELDFANLDIPNKGKLSKQDLVDAEAGRTDQFSTVASGRDYQSYSLPTGKANPTYREKVTTFRQGAVHDSTDYSKVREAQNEVKRADSLYDDELYAAAKAKLDIELRAIDPLYDKAGMDPMKAASSMLRGEWSKQPFSAEEAEAAIQRAWDNPEDALDELNSVFDSETAQLIAGELDDGANPRALADMYSRVGGPTTKIEGSRYTSSHFPETPDYLMHSRVYDDSFDGMPTRVVQEIQSDLHQAGRQQGYDTGTTSLTSQEATTISNFMDGLAETGGNGFDAVIPIARRHGLDPGHDEFPDQLENLLETGLGSSTIPKSPFEKTWLRKGLEREINDALEEGMGQIAIPIKGSVSSLQRGEGVQKWYENVVASTAKKLAKSKGMDFEMKTITATGDGHTISDDHITLIETFTEHMQAGWSRQQLVDSLFNEPRLQQVVANEGSTPIQMRTALINAASETKEDVVYAVIKPKADAAKPGFALYSTPTAAVGAAAIMLQEGHSQDEINALLTEEGFEGGELEEIFGQAQAAATMKEEGYTDEEIKPLLSSQEVNATGSTSEAASTLQEQTPGTMTDAYLAVTGNEELTPKELVAALEVIYPDMSSVTTNVAGLLGDQEAKRYSEEAVKASKARIVDGLAARGLNAKFDMWTDPGSGSSSMEWIATTEDGEFKITPEWYQSFWEAKGEIIGAVSGGMASFGASVEASALIPHPVVKGLFILGGTILGTAVGAMGGTELDYMHEAMVLQEDFEGEVMARKAMTAAELSIIGDFVGAGVIKVAGKSWRGIVQAKDFISDKAFNKARKALKETMFISDDEAAELVTKLSKVADIPGKSETDRAIAAVAATKPGAEDLVKAAAATDSTAGQAVAKSIDDRAQDVLASTKDLTGEDIGRWVRDDLEGYKTLVKEDFTRVKNAAASAPGANRFTFDYDKLAIDPVLKRLQGNIENKDLAFKFARQSQRIKAMSKSRRLPDLIELRKLVNEFKYNSRISSAKDFEMLDGLRDGIDHAIESGAYATMDKPKTWLKAWKASNKAYSEMKVLETNTLMKVLTRPGVSEKAIGLALTKYAGAVDSTFVDVLAKLPKKSRTRVEGAVINSLAEKFAAGSEGGQRAINFPLLQRELNAVSFTTPEARSMKKAIGELAEVFRNDIPLAQAAGGIQIPKFQSFLTADPVIRAKFEIASGVFNYVKSLAPTQSARSLSLVRKAAKVLENPMNSKSIRELREALDGEINIDQQLGDMVKSAAQQQSTNGGMPRVRLYGDGNILVGKGKGKERSIPMHRIADTETIKRIADAASLNLADKKALDIALKERGYMAAQLGADKVRLLEK